MAALPHSEEDWESRKDTILSLFLGNKAAGEDNQDSSQRQTMRALAETMRVRHGFAASESQYETRLRGWKARKNLKPREWKSVFEKLDNLPQGTKSRVLISGHVVSQKTINRSRRYFKQKHSVAMNSAMQDGWIAAAFPREVHIEIQGPTGNWNQLSHSPNSNTTQSSALLNYTQRNATNPTPLSSIDFQPMTPINATATSLVQHSSATGFSPPMILHGSCESITLASPLTWLRDLPSTLFLNTLGSQQSNIFNGINHRSDSPICLSTDTVGAMSIEPLSVRGNSTLNDWSLLDAGDNETVVPISDAFRSPWEQRIMCPEDIRSSNFILFLLSTFVSGVSDLEYPPLAVVDGVLSSNGTLHPFLLRIFQSAPKYVATTLAMKLFHGAIVGDRCDIVAQLLKRKLFDVNKTFFIHHQSRYKPLQYVTKGGKAAMLKLLFQYGADPDKFYQEGTGHLSPRDCFYSDLSYRFRRCGQEFGCDKQVKDLLRILFNTKAATYPQLIDICGFEFCVILPQIFPNRSISFHEQIFEKDEGLIMMSKLGDSEGAEFMNNVVSHCREQHHGNCLLKYQAKLYKMLLESAATGHTQKFHALLPLSPCFRSNHIDSRVLSASIRSRNNRLINLVMSRNPDINPPPAQISNVGGDVIYRDSSRPTTPLAESILNDNHQLIDLFENEGVFENLHAEGRFEAAVLSAVAARKPQIVARLLQSCPDFELYDMSEALMEAISTNQEDVGLMLIERGASIYSGSRGTRGFGTSFTLHHDVKGHQVAKFMPSLLKVGIQFSAVKDFNPVDIIRVALSWEDASTVEDLISSFHHETRFHDMQNRSAEEEYDGLVLASDDDKTIPRLILETKLATEETLTALLACALSRNDHQLIELLIKRGGNTRDERILAFSVKHSPDLLPLLFDKTNCHVSVPTKGFMTKVLKNAILKRPCDAHSVSTLIQSGFVDIFDTGHCYRQDPALTPLGVALEQSYDSPVHSHNVVSLLLDSGCDPNTIVEFQNQEGPCINQTALLKAIEVKNKEIIRLLMNRGAHINDELRHQVRRTPLQKAAEMGDVGIVQLLLELGADVNAPPAFSLGGTALQLAAISGNCETAAELICHGALLHMQPSKIGGRWPIEGAAEHGRLDMIHFLWKANAETLYLGDGENGFREKNFRKAMRLASENGHEGCKMSIAELANLPMTSTDTPPVESPMYASKAYLRV